jgi:ubiquinone/menaquinone biosynthesis C-methylase UbiE
MANSDPLFAGSIPRLYDSLMVPMLFEPYASDMAKRVAAYRPGAVLETAAGSGAVTRALAPLLARDVRWVVTDLNLPMLDHAAARQGPDARIEWQQADAVQLPFADASFDAVYCQFGVMFFPSQLEGYREACRVLKPGGHFVFNVWDRIEHNALADAVYAATTHMFPDEPLQFFVRTPHGHHDLAHIRDELQRAGFADVHSETLEKVSHATSALEAATALCQGTPLRNQIEARGAGMLQRVTDKAAELIDHRHGPGPVSGKMQAHVIVATR